MPPGADVLRNAVSSQPAGEIAATPELEKVSTRFVPPYRLFSEIFARLGAEIPDTTLVDWCGGAMKELAPLIDKIGKGVKQGRIWVYVRDRIHDHKINRLDEILPWNWKPQAAETARSDAA
ncbi:transposase IS66 family protein [Rhodovulum visakhapatnamense]|uniref:Transposase IS66 family protein n=1 Tax=Rhodovulum visakhapatnamense TaxID=364297 RepID=A0A4R8F9N5_9RHOB|nr:transposase IS66 family protein [Rhodovulum visakhapatnamense]